MVVYRYSTCLVLAGALLVSAAPANAAQSPSSLEWQELAPPVSPWLRERAASAYDSQKDMVVMFGGNSCCGGRDDTWLYDGETWSELAVNVRPERRDSASMAYDAARHETVLYGGSCGECVGAFGDTWIFDGKSWTERTPAVSPPPLYGASFVYDPEHKNVVLFGGSRGQSYDLSAETWVWDGAIWKQQHPQTSPPARYSAGGAYSAARHAVVLFGGHDSGPPELNDTWLWNGRTWKEDRSTAAISPREGPAMTSYGRRVILFGGYTYSKGFFNDTWALGAHGWHLRARGSADSPSARSVAATAYDSLRHRVVMFGGYNGEVPDFGDTWALQSN